MKAPWVNKALSVLVASIFAVLFFSAVSVQAKASVSIITGTVVSVDANSGKLEIVDRAGRTLNLKAVPDKKPETMEQLKTLQEGEKVTVEYDDKGIILSINIQMGK